MPASTRNRSLCGLALIACSARVNRSPDELSALTITRRLSASIAATTLAIASGEVRDGGCPCTSIAGNFALGTGCTSVTSVERGR